MNKRAQVINYLIFDVAGSAVAWVLYNIFRKSYIESQLFGYPIHFQVTLKFITGLILFPLFWVVLFSLAGLYQDVFRKSRLKELSVSLGFTILGCLFIFFILLLNDYILSYRTYYLMLLSIFVLVFTLTYFPRLAITSSTIHRIHRRKIGFNTIIIGDGEKALELFSELESQQKSQGYKILGYLSTGAKEPHALSNVTTHLGDIRSVSEIVKENGVEEVLIALDKSDNRNLVKIINELLCLNVSIKAIPSLYDHLTGRVKMSGILGAALFQISFELLTPWQIKLKELLDYLSASLALVVISPLAIGLSIVIKLSSRGPVLLKQERVGQYGKPFLMYKFRSMYLNAEENGPALSSRNDPRVTPVGRYMRKTRLDEIPNFINVLMGDMSLVGPRPERQFYIDKIVKVAPHYIHLQKVKPGITSWGQVKFGYAENVDQMVKRLKYDLLYLENMSIFVDLKIIIYTLITVFKGRGV